MVNDTSVVPIEALQPDLSGFGKHLYGLMLSRGIKSFSALAAAMDCDDYRVHRQTITKYAKGDQPVQPRFTRRATEVLNLTEDEERKLSWFLHKYG